MFETGGYQFNIKQLLVIETNTYKPIFHRTYTLSTTTNTLNRLYDVARPQGTRKEKLTDNHIANFVPDIINMDPATQGMVEIPNGWGTDRLRFLLEIEYSVMGILYTAYIQGFSEYNEASHSGLLDPNMKFYINSIFHVTRQQDPITGRVIVRPYEMYNVLSDINNASHYGQIDRGQQKMIRPHDMFNANYLENKYNPSTTTGITNTSDTLDTIRANPSKRSNNNPLTYLATGLNAYREAQVASNISWDAVDLYKNANIYTAEPDLTANPFIFAISNYTGALAPNSFTINMLQAFDPYVTQKIKKIVRQQINLVSQYNTALDTTDTADTLQPTIENTTAAFLANIIPALCSECLISDCTISITNTSGEPLVFILNPLSLVENLDIVGFVERLEVKIKQLVIPKLTHFNQLLVEVFINCDIMGDFTVSISINGAPPTIIRYPAFADALYTPMITTAQNKEVLMDNFNMILDSTYGAVDNEARLMSPDVQNNFPGGMY